MGEREGGRRRGRTVVRGWCACTKRACVYLHAAVGVVGFKAARFSLEGWGWGMCKMWPETGSELKFTLDSLTLAIGGG